MRSHNKALPKLFEAGSYSEAIQILGARKASPVYRQIVDLAYKIKDDTGKVRENMLREAETNLKKEEQGLIGTQMSESIHEEADTEGAGGKESGSGETAQADGRTTDTVAPPGDGSHDASQPAQSQSGTSQLEAPLAEAIDQVADMGSVDPMNTAVIDYIDDGMSKTEATNAAAKDNNMMEAVFAKEFKKHMLPLLKGMQKDFNAYKEAIIAVDSKVEGNGSGQIQMDTGYSETIQTPIVPKKISEIDEKSIEESRSDIAAKYLN